MSAITIVVVDDHPIFRQGVIDTLSLELDFSVIGQAKGGEEGLDIIRQLKPDIAIVDVNLPDINGQQVTRQVVSDKIPTRIILLTAYDDKEQRLHSMRVGAYAYCVKDVLPDTFIKTIREVMAGKYLVGDLAFDHVGLQRWLASQTEGAIRAYGDPGEPYEPLSSREMEVLILMTEGKSNKEIAASLSISRQTVKNHITAILRKLGVEDRTQAAVYALRRGWVRVYEQK